MADNDTAGDAGTVAEERKNPLKFLVFDGIDRERDPDLELVSKRTGKIQPYYFADAGSFGLLKRDRMGRLYKRIGELELRAQGGTATEEDEQEHFDKLIELAGMAVPDAPPEDISRLGTAQLYSLITAFFAQIGDSPAVGVIQELTARAVAKRAAAGAAALAPNRAARRSQRIGGKPLRASRGSTGREK